LDVEEGFGSSAIHGYSQIPTRNPLAYYYAHQSPAENLKLYKKYVSRLALAVTSRLADDVQGSTSTQFSELPANNLKCRKCIWLHNRHLWCT
jgi:polyribonucleotide 5'-hydroxyl-kinase